MMSDKLLTTRAKTVSGTVVNLDEFNLTAAERIEEGSTVYIGSDGLAYAIKDETKATIIEGKATKIDTVNDNA